MAVRSLLLLTLALFIGFPAGLSARETTLVSPETGSYETVWRNRGGYFPGIYFTDVIHAARIAEESYPYWVRTKAEQESYSRLITDYSSLLLNNDILAFYGHPRSRNMGILGRYPIEELDQRLTALAQEYESEGGRSIIKAFYIIFGTAWPEGEIGIINQDILKQWVEYAFENDMLVFIDHQIGRHDPIASLKRMFPWLHYPNVHLALDPEWRTTKPMQEIGHLTAEEINRAQQVMEDYLIEHDLPGERFFVIHQFNWRMIRNREKVQSDFGRVRLVHCISGIGTPTEKRATYEYGARATNMPVKGFKLWFNFNLPGNHHDRPLMTPQEVYELSPRPYIIMYQ
ncbi:MAG: hypothetical protein FWD36_02150 [Treponema sp.]|nr:hypothetical protein [Treponema sp.]